MDVLLAMVCAAGAALVVVPAPNSAARRLRPATASGARRRARPDAKTRDRWLLASLVALLVAVVIGGAAGAFSGLTVFGLFARRLLQGRAAAVAARQRRLLAELPLAADLLGACIAAGAPPDTAADAVADAVGGETGDELRRVTAALRLGGDPAATWLSLAVSDALAPLGRAFARAVDTGAPLADLLADTAAAARQRRRSAAEGAARRVGVHAAAPLGLCFLPAFVLLAIVPVVAGLVRTLTLFG